MATATQNPDGSWTTDEGDGVPPLTWRIGADPNGSGRLQILVAPPDKTPACFMETEQVSGKASARLVNQGGTPWISTQGPTIPNPEAGEITWDG